MGKNVAVFFDGTRNRKRLNGGTNVNALYKMARAASGAQRCLYLSGVGTERIKNTAIDALRDRAGLGKDYHRINTGALGRLFGALAGYGIGARIKEAYAFIVDNYDEFAQDKLFLFGFSRGAFAARSLAGFIGEVGLLFKDHLAKVPVAYELYRSGRGREFLEANFSSMLGQHVVLGEGLRVYMVGVWDTVGALGLPPPFQKIAWQTDHHLVHEMPWNVTHGRHALALHELRSIFAPVPWKRSRASQFLEQVWFAGAHADVGGGYEGSTLSTIPLLWMAFEAEKLGLSLSHEVLHVQDTTTEIHHEIRGIFSLCTPQRRKLIDSLIKPSGDEAASSHSVHWSAIRRQERRKILDKPYPHRRAIRTVLSDIDALTKALAGRLADHAEQENAEDKSDLYGDQKAALSSMLTTNSEWTREAIDELVTAILMVKFVHGWEELVLCISRAIDHLAAKICTPISSPNSQAAALQLEGAIRALRLTTGSFLNEEFSLLIERLALYSKMNHGLPDKFIKLKKMKI